MRKKKQRVTLFLDPIIVRRGKAAGALEALTFSEIAERSLEAYTPKVLKEEVRNNVSNIK